MIIQLPGQMSIFDIIPLKKKEEATIERHDCPHYMFIKNGLPYAKHTCTKALKTCGQCQVSMDFSKERDKMMATGMSLYDAISKAKDSIYEKYGEKGELIPA